MTTEELAEVMSLLRRLTVAAEQIAANTMPAPIKMADGTVETITLVEAVHLIANRS